MKTLTALACLIAAVMLSGCRDFPEVGVGDDMTFALKASPIAWLQGKVKKTHGNWIVIVNEERKEEIWVRKSEVAALIKLTPDKK